jgi:hypothetical protein
MNSQTADYQRDRIRRVRLGWVVALLASLLLPASGLCAAEADLSRPDQDGTPTRVRLDLYLADLYEIAGSEQSFLAEVFVEAEWQDARLARRWTGVHGAAPLDDGWNPRLQFVNQRGVTISPRAWI